MLFRSNSAGNIKATVKAIGIGDSTIRYRYWKNYNNISTYFYINVKAPDNVDTITPAPEQEPGEGELEPGTVAAKKTAKWVDYHERIAEITLSVEGMPIISGSDVILVMDVSGSMSDDNRIGIAQEASNKFITEMLKDKNKYNNRVAFIPFHGSSGGTNEAGTVTNGRVNFSTDLNLLKTHVDGTVANGDRKSVV